MLNQPLLCSYPNVESLHQAYMPFVRNGGVFIRFSATLSPEDVQMGQTLTLSIQLPQSSSSITIEGQVVWLTPPGAKSNKPPGVGVMWVGETALKLKQDVETLLGPLMTSDKLTDTF
jgi:type IV pilus assembly protein PilZ